MTALGVVNKEFKIVSANSSGVDTAVLKMESKDEEWLLSEGRVKRYQEALPCRAVIFRAELELLAEHFSNKFGIRIYLNGEATKSGNAIIARNKKHINETIARLMESSTKYVTILQEQLDPDSPFNSPPYALSKNNKELPQGNWNEESWYEKLEQAISQFLIKKDGVARLRTDLSVPEIAKLNGICLNKDFQNILDKVIGSYIEKLEQDLVEGRYSLQYAECLKEIEELRDGLKQGETIGYIVSLTPETLHHEVIVVTKDSIYKPIQWPRYGSEYSSANPLSQEIDWVKRTYIPVMSCPILSCKESEDLPITPQSKESNGCNALGLFYLVELLKDNAHQFKELSFCFIYKDVNYFVPPPSVLVSSESNLYNQLLAAMVSEETDSVSVKAQRKKPGFFTKIECIFEAVTVWKMLEGQDELRQKFKPFAVKWLEQYKVAMDKRKKYTDPYLNLNRALEYIILSMKDVASEIRKLRLEQKPVQNDLPRATF